MAATTRPLLWESYREIVPDKYKVANASYDLFGTSHYFDKDSQDLYLQNGVIKTITSMIQDGQWADRKREAPITIEEFDNTTLSMASIDHTSTGTMYAVGFDGTDIVYYRYIYAMDVSGVVDSWDYKADADNSIVSYNVDLMNFETSIFDCDYSLFEPGSRMIFKLLMGEDTTMQIGVGYMDSISFSQTDETISISGRNAIGFYLKDQTFDDRTSFSGSAGKVCREILEYAGIRDYMVQDLDRSANYDISDSDNIMDGILDVLNLCYNNEAVNSEDNVARIIELADGKICVGLASWMEQELIFQNGYYTFNRGSDVFSRKVKKSIDSCFTKVRATGQKNTTTDLDPGGGTSSGSDKPVDDDAGEDLAPGVEASTYYDWWREDATAWEKERNSKDYNKLNTWIYKNWETFATASPKETGWPQPYLNSLYAAVEAFKANDPEEKLNFYANRGFYDWLITVPFKPNIAPDPVNFYISDFNYLIDTFFGRGESGVPSKSEMDSLPVEQENVWWYNFWSNCDAYNKLPKYTPQNGVSINDSLKYYMCRMMGITNYSNFNNRYITDTSHALNRCTTAMISSWAAKTIKNDPQNTYQSGDRYSDIVAAICNGAQSILNTSNPNGSDYFPVETHMLTKGQWLGTEDLKGLDGSVIAAPEGGLLSKLNLTSFIGSGSMFKQDLREYLTNLAGGDSEVFNLSSLTQWAHATENENSDISDLIGSGDTNVDVENNMLNPVTVDIPHYSHWTRGTHRTKQISAPSGFTQSQLSDWANSQAKQYQMGGIQETFTSPFRPQLQIGDIAEFEQERSGQTYGVTIGYVTSVSHKFDRKKGYSTDFTVDSAGMDSGDVEHTSNDSVTVAVPNSGVNRPTRLLDMTSKLRFVQNFLDTKVNCTTIRLNEVVDQAKRGRVNDVANNDRINALNLELNYIWSEILAMRQNNTTT